MASLPGAGAGPPQPQGDNVLFNINEALNLIHSPQTPNEERSRAEAYLNSIKRLGEAPTHGFTLAIDKSQPAVVRHFGLSLLEDAVRRRWADYTDEQADCIKNWIIQLAQSASPADAPFLRNKIALLWVEIAKRAWTAEWVDMDHTLVALWDQLSDDSLIHKEFVLQILELLSDEIFNQDDVVVAMRTGELNRAAVEIFLASSTLLELHPNRQAEADLRCGTDGWLVRVTQFLDHCLTGDNLNGDHVRACAVRAFAVLASATLWAELVAFTVARSLDVMCRGLATPHVAVQKAALEALYSLFSQTAFSDRTFRELVVPMYGSGMIDLSRRLLEWSAVDATDIDDDKYQFAKKFSEMIASLANLLDKRCSLLPADTDIQRYLELLLLVAQSPSLVVSVPALASWTRMLANSRFIPILINASLIGPLLELASSRLIRYESFPDDSQDPSYLFLIEDTDLQPERHALMGNYRRYCSQIIASIVQIQLRDAFTHLLGRTELILQNLLVDQPQTLDVARYSKNSATVLTIDGYCTALEAALKGLGKLRRQLPQDQLKVFAANFEPWCNRLLELKAEDPLIRKRLIQILVAFSTTALNWNANFMLRVLEHILMTWPTPSPDPSYKVFNDAIKELQNEAIFELPRLASNMPDALLAVYDQIESKVQEMIASGLLDEKRQIAYRTFLFMIIHRAGCLDVPSKTQRLRAFVDPIKAQWTDANLTQAISSFQGFAGLIGLMGVQHYLADRRVHEIRDWGAVPLDAEGLAVQATLEGQQLLNPLRITKSFLTYSTDKPDRESPLYQVTCNLWADAYPTILPGLLRFLSHAQAFHNPANWSLLPEEMRPVVNKALTDRFWQAGISEGTRDDFYARILEKKSTLEGLGSSIRSALRYVRESAYAILYCMSRLDIHFFGFKELPDPLAQALFVGSDYLSAQQLVGLLSLVKHLVDTCPVHLRAAFLPPLLVASFTRMDAKISSEWDKLGRQDQVQAAADELTEEMRTESILRQLTFAAIMMVAEILDPDRKNPPRQVPLFEGEKVPVYDNLPTLRRFCFTNLAIVEPLLVFLCHMIRVRDTRCCQVVLKIFISIIPDIYALESSIEQVTSLPPDDPSARVRQPDDMASAGAMGEFICIDVLKACLTSLHEPYFVDLQKELCLVIAVILQTYYSITPTPRNILCSLPGIADAELYRAVQYICRRGISPRQQRAAVMQMLHDLKGVSIPEMGKLAESVRAASDSRAAQRKTTRSKLMQALMTNDGSAASASAQANGGAADDGRPGGGITAPRTTPDFEGMAAMFGDVG